MAVGIKTIPRILLAEDDHTIAHMILRVLQVGVSYEVTWVKDGQEALERVNEVKPDLLLLDLMMPHRNGFEVCRSLRANPRWAEVPICILTALTDQQAHQAAIGAGADRILLKPFRANELRLAIESLLEKDAAERLLVEALENARAKQVDLVRFLVHDLRGPLTVLRSSLNILGKQKLPPTTVDLLESGQDAVLRLASMVDSILVGMDSSQLGALPMNEVFDLGQVVEGASKELSVLFRARELTVIKRLDDAPRTVRGRADLFRIAVTNLLINAVEHSPLEGELVIQSGLSEAGDFQLRITDQGPGIPQEVQEDIFTPEELSSLKSRGVRLGRGLGLVVTRLAIERLGGRVNLVAPHHHRFMTALELTIPKQCFLASASQQNDREPSSDWTGPIRLAMRLFVDGREHEVFTKEVSKRGASVIWSEDMPFPESERLLVSLVVSPQAKTEARFAMQDGELVNIEWSDPSAEFLDFMEQVRKSLS